MSTTRTTETASAVSQGQGRKPGLQVTAENERGISIRRKPCGKRDQHDRYHNRGHSEPFLFVASAGGVQSLDDESLNESDFRYNTPKPKNWEPTVKAIWASVATTLLYSKTVT